VRLSRREDDEGKDHVLVIREESIARERRENQVDVIRGIEIMILRGNTRDVEIGMNCQLATKTTTMTTMNAR